MRNKLLGLLMAAFTLCFGAMVPAAHADNYQALNITMNMDYTVGLSGPVNVTAYASPQVITLKDLSTMTISQIVFYCLDIYHDDFLGAQPDPDVFVPGLITTNFGGTNLTADQIAHDKAILAAMGGADALHQAAGQVALWIVNNQGLGLNVNFLGQTLFQNTTMAYVDSTARIAGSLPGIINVSGYQSGVGVPEAATWTLMILGFGGIGAMLRRRRQLAPA